MRDVFLKIRLTPAERAELRVLADARGGTMAAVARGAIREVVARELERGAPAPTPEAR